MVASTSHLHVKLMNGSMAPKVVTPVVTYLESVYSAQSSSMMHTGNRNLRNNPQALKAVHAILNSSIKWL